jgi:hypothetical protein
LGELWEGGSIIFLRVPSAIQTLGTGRFLYYVAVRRAQTQWQYSQLACVLRGCSRTEMASSALRFRVGVEVEVEVAWVSTCIGSLMLSNCWMEGF